MAATEAQVAAAGKAIHEANLWQYDECDHGSYSGGTSHGLPYAMCDLMARRIADAVVAAGLPTSEGEDANDRLLRAEGFYRITTVPVVAPSATDEDGA